MIRALIATLSAMVAALAQEPQSPPPTSGNIPRQQENRPPAEPDRQPERWNLFYQATSIGQYHGTFNSPYQGPFSLRNYTERDVSLTTTIFLGIRIAKNTLLYFNPEIAGGRGFSGVNGIANFSNGELPRVASATPKPYLARLYITQDFGWGDESETQSSAENQLGGNRSAHRYSITVGRFTVTDFFDNNRYTHDPRTQFMTWGTMFNGAWDYPADTRGYTWGWVHELHMPRWSLRYGSAAEPRVANGGRFDRRLFRDRGDMLEGEYRFGTSERPGAVRLLGSLLHTNSGTYSEALKLPVPDVIATRRVGTLKYGLGFNAEQALTSDLGVFARLGWNDGKTESFAFTAIDRLASGGVSLTGSRWKRKDDTVGAALTVSGLSGVHRLYLARGGLDFLFGDGRLTYGTERVFEAYYSALVVRGLWASFDLQHVTNPAYNQDRGPVWIPSIRLHLEFGKPKI